MNLAASITFSLSVHTRRAHYKSERVMPALLELGERASVGLGEREAEWLVLRELDSPEVRGVELTLPQRLDLRLHLRSQLHAHAHCFSSSDARSSTRLSRNLSSRDVARNNSHDVLVRVLVHYHYHYLHLGRESHLRSVHVLSQRVHLKAQVQRMHAHHSFALNTGKCTRISTRSSNYWRNSSFAFVLYYFTVFWCTSTIYP